MDRITVTVTDGCYHIVGPQPAPWMTGNQRLHWARSASATRGWRDYGYWMGHQLLLHANRNGWTIPDPATVQLVAYFRTQRRRDPHNWIWTLKPLVDGMVDAGVWPDDTPTHVRTVEPLLIVDGTRRVELRLAATSPAVL